MSEAQEPLVESFKLAKLALTGRIGIPSMLRPTYSLVTKNRGEPRLSACLLRLVEQLIQLTAVLGNQRMASTQQLKYLQKGTVGCAFVIATITLK